MPLISWRRTSIRKCFRLGRKHPTFSISCALVITTILLISYLNLKYLSYISFLSSAVKYGVVTYPQELIRETFTTDDDETYGNLTQIKTQIILQSVKMETKSVVLPEVNTTILNPSVSKSCKDGGAKMFSLFMFTTAPENYQNRNAIRKIYNNGIPQWEKLIVEWDGRSKGDNDKRNFNYDQDHRGVLNVLFFIGITNDTQLRENITQEWKLHGDIILDDFEESYWNLTVKTLRMLKWVENNCAEVPFLIKIDDDVHLNVPMLLDLVYYIRRRTHGGRYLVAGHEYSNVVRETNPNSKSFTPISLWNKGAYPDFVAGFVYVLGSQIRSDLYKLALDTPLFHLEDVYLTGIVRSKHWLSKNEIVGLPNIYWYRVKIPSVCYLKHSLLAAHGLSYDQLICYWTFLQRDVKCDTVVEGEAFSFNC